MATSSVENEFLSAASIIQLTGYCQIAAYVILLYDHLLNLDQEVKHIWRSKLSTITVAYCIIRYGSSILASFSILAFATHQSYNFCRTYIFTQPWPACCIFWLVQIVLQMRLYVLYNRSKTVLAIMVMCFIGEIVATTVILILSDITMQITNEPLPTLFICAIISAPKVLLSFWWVTLVFETILCFLAIYAGIRRSRQGYRVRPFSRTTIADVILTGNVSYYIIIIVVTIVNAVMWQRGLQWIEVTEGIAPSLQVITGCHLILHLRDVADSQLHGTFIPTLPKSQPTADILMSTFPSGGAGESRWKLTIPSPTPSQGV